MFVGGDFVVVLDGCCPAPMPVVVMVIVWLEMEKHVQYSLDVVMGTVLAMITQVINSDELSARGKCITLDQQTGKLKVETVQEPKPSSDNANPKADAKAGVNTDVNTAAKSDVNPSTDANVDANTDANADVDVNPSTNIDADVNTTVNSNTDIKVESELQPPHDDAALPNDRSSNHTEDTHCDPDTQDVSSAATASAAAASVDTTLDISTTECSSEAVITDSENMIHDVE